MVGEGGEWGGKWSGKWGEFAVAEDGENEQIVEGTGRTTNDAGLHSLCATLATPRSSCFRAVYNLSMAQRTEAVTREPRSKTECVVHVLTPQRLDIIFVLECL